MFRGVIDFSCTSIHSTGTISIYGQGRRYMYMYLTCLDVSLTLHNVLA